MRYLHASIGGAEGGFVGIDSAACEEQDPVSPDTTPPDAPSAEQSRAAREVFRRHLSTVLRCENLVVLCGLGTSLCIREENSRRFPTMEDLWNAARGRDEKAFDKICSEAKYTDQESPNIEELLSRVSMVQKLDPSRDRENFITATEDLIWDKCSYSPTPEDLEHHGQFLNSLVRRPTKLARTKLFTTNYDLCFESASSSKGFVVIDGFSHTHPQKFSGSHFEYDFVRRGSDGGRTPEFLPNVLHLYKLHGSVDWSKATTGSIERSAKPERPVMIYPRDSKFQASYEQPYFEMMSRFHTSLRKPDLGLLVIGFGFSDDHITEPIRSALASNISIKMLVVDPSLEERFRLEPTTNQERITSSEATSPKKKLVPTRTHNYLKRLIENGDDRVGLLNACFEDFVKELPLLISKTDEELHLERVRKASNQ